MRGWDQHALEITEMFASDVNVEQLVDFCRRSSQIPDRFRVICRDGLDPRVVRRRTHSDAGVRHGVPRTPVWCDPAARAGGGERRPGAATAAPADDAAEVLEYLRRLEAQGSPGLAADVIEIFLQDTSNRLTALRQAIAKRDGETVFRVAHTCRAARR